MISYGKQNIDQEDIKAVCKVLENDLLTCGPKLTVPCIVGQNLFL